MVTLLFALGALASGQFYRCRLALVGLLAVACSLWWDSTQTLYFLHGQVDAAEAVTGSYIAKAVRTYYAGEHLCRHPASVLQRVALLGGLLADSPELCALQCSAGAQQHTRHTVLTVSTPRAGCIMSAALNGLLIIVLGISQESAPVADTYPTHTATANGKSTTNPAYNENVGGNTV